VALRRGLREGGYVEGQNITIEYRFSDGQYDRLPALMTELTGRQVSVLVVAGVAGTDGTVTQQMRASQIPIVFNVGGDPVRAGLVASMNRPGGNMTGISGFELTGKNFGLLHELVPDAKTVATLVDARVADSAELRGAREAAATLGVQVRVLVAGSDGELDSAFATLNRERVDAMVVSTTPFLISRAKQIVALVARYRVPAIYNRRQFAEAGGLMSYSYDVPDAYRQMGIYTARILKGTKPADLPVFQPTKFELVIGFNALFILVITQRLATTQCQTSIQV
jgi:putative ABC transport system substrate-binding protein